MINITTDDGTTWIDGMTKRNRNTVKEYKEVITTLENGNSHISVSNSPRNYGLVVYDDGAMRWAIDFKSEKTMKAFHTQLRTETKVKYPIC